MTCHILDLTTYYFSKRKKLREGKKGASYMWTQQKRPNKVYFYTTILTKLNILTKQQKKELFKKIEEFKY